jgi:hypothetical protein
MTDSDSLMVAMAMQKRWSVDQRRDARPFGEAQGKPSETARWFGGHSPPPLVERIVTSLRWHYPGQVPNSR